MVARKVARKETRMLSVVCNNNLSDFIAFVITYKMHNSSAVTKRKNDTSVALWLGLSKVDIMPL